MPDFPYDVFLSHNHADKPRTDGRIDDSQPAGSDWAQLESGTVCVGAD